MRGGDVHRDDMFDEDPTIAAFARDLRAAAAATPAPAVGPALAAVLDGRAPATAYPDVIETPRARVVRRPGRLRWAVAGAAALVGAGSLGVAGALPGPVQRQVSRMAEVIGVDVPDGEDDAETTTTTAPRPTTTTASTTIATTTSTAPPVGTTVLAGEQDAGEDPGKPAPERDDEGGRGRGRGGVDGEPDDRDDDARGGDSSRPESGDADVDVEVERGGPGNRPDPGAEDEDRGMRDGAGLEDLDSDVAKSRERA